MSSKKVEVLSDRRVSLIVFAVTSLGNLVIVIVVQGGTTRVQPCLIFQNILVQVDVKQ